MTQDAADAFIRYEAADGETIEVVVEPFGVCAIGRADSNTIVLADKMASREHAIVRRNASGDCIFIDLASTNGTWVNDRRVEVPTMLASGDVIQIGQRRMTFVQGTEKPAPAAPARAEFFVEQQIVSVLVLDIRSYANIAIQLEPKRYADMTNFIRRETDALCKEANCLSVKHIGGAMIALWTHSGNRLQRSDVVGALGIIRGCQDVFQAVQEKYELPSALSFGCGYSAGSASIGNVGGPGTPVVTARGDTVDIAFGLEEATHEADCDVLIAKSVFERLSGARFTPPNCSEYNLKGLEQPVTALPLRFGHIRWLSEQLRGG